MKNEFFFNKQKMTVLANVSVLLAATLILCRCGGAQPQSTESDIPKTALPEEGAPAAQTKTIKAAYEPFFPVGVAVGPNHLATVQEIITTHFNRLTAENDMKFGPVHPGPDTWEFANADAIADFARQHQMKMTGHALVWHRMQPDWLFEGLKPGDPKSIETLRTRLKDHVFTIVARYADVIDNWDVVNEAISDTPDKTFRDGSEDSKWYEIYGDESYMVDAFTFAKEALEKATGTAEGQLYYNDYNVIEKLDKILKVAKWLRDEKGIPVAGIGMQAHWNLETPKEAAVEAAIKAISEAGFKVKISELDLSIYPHDDWTNQVWEPAKEFDETVKAIQASRFETLFALFRKNSDVITSVTFWGVSDDATWLDTFPVEGRDNHPLLFDDDHQPKQSVAKIVNF